MFSGGWRLFNGKAAMIFCFVLGTFEVRAQPVVTGPVPGKPNLLLGNFDLSASGYSMEEFFFSGTAASYKAKGALSEDGRWNVQSAASAPYKSRIVVIRPVDSKKFNGTVVVEWLNVSLGIDFPPDWVNAHREIIRSGFAYVAVSAQKVGIDGGTSLDPNALPLKKVDAARYGSLDHPGDAFSYDIFSQVASIIRKGEPRVLGPLTVKHILAIGDSQSAMYLTTYVNAVDPLARVYDGFLLHGRSAPAASFDGVSILNNPQALKVVKVRPDVRVPVFTINSETDVIGPLSGARIAPFYYARQEDTNRVRVWEVAGAAHAGGYVTNVGLIDSGFVPIAQLASAYQPTNTVQNQVLAKPMDYDPQQHYVLEAALQALNSWVASGKAPRKAAPLETTGGKDVANDPVKLVVDANGNAQGGVRTPWLDVPIAHMSGVGNTGAVMASLEGVTEMFDPTTLAKLYPGGRNEYVAKFDQSLNSTISRGFILPTDRKEIEEVAKAMYPNK